MHSASTPTVIILFADALAAPEVHWSLVDAGIPVVALARRGTRPALRRSRHARVVEVTNPASSASRCLTELEALVRQFEDPIVMPLDDLAIWLVHRLRESLPVRVCGPTDANAALTLDKRLQLEAAARAGFSVPETIAVDSAADLARVERFPIIVKPALAARVERDALGRGRAFALANSTQRDQSGFVADPQEPMIGQPHIAGVGEGVFGLVLGGKVVAWSGHRRVRMMNPAGSGSSACINIAPEARTLAAAERFLLAMNWQGLFMIELLRDTDGRLWFMELNGRPWGSIALALRTGLDYPAWAVRAMLDPVFEPIVPSNAPTLLCRHVGREILHLAFVARGPGRGALKTQWPTLSGTLRSMLAPGRPQAIYNWRWNDPLVFFADLAGSIAQLLPRIKSGGASGSGIASRIRRRLAAIAERQRQRALRARGLPLPVIQQARSVLFLCYGNINRSALAERYLRPLLGDGYTVMSCGLHRYAQRAADPQMVAVARDSGVDLDNWSSRTINAELVRAADVIFAMEAVHLSRLFAGYPETRDRAFLLGSLNATPDGPLEIQDPFGKPRAAYERCLREVVAATSTLARHLATSSLLTEPKR